ncbi:hypothetical protein KAR48_11370 [bacterium]|nr:hypothetical protein [bacterium]
MPKGQAEREPHLWVLLCDPVGDPPFGLLARIRTARDGYDRTCVLDECDLDFIDHESIIEYALADVINLDKLANLVKNYVAEPKEQVKESVLTRIRAGILISNHINLDARKFYREKVLKLHEVPQR